jgi:hypothetical protein
MGKGKGKGGKPDETTPLLPKPSYPLGNPRSKPIPIGGSGREEHRITEASGKSRRGTTRPQSPKENGQKKRKKPASSFIGGTGLGFATGHTFYLNDSSDSGETDD